MAEPRNDGRVEPGQSISTAFSATQWNRMADAADLVLDRELSRSAAGPAIARGVNVVRVRNYSGRQVPIYGVLALRGVLPSPAGKSFSDQEVRQFSSQFVFGGDVPDVLVEQDAFTFAVALRPIADGAVGPMAVSGVFPCKVKIFDDEHRFARARYDDVTQLASVKCGPVRLLWHEGTEGDDKWAIGVM